MSPDGYSRRGVSNQMSDAMPVLQNQTTKGRISVKSGGRNGRNIVSWKRQLSNSPFSVFKTDNSVIPGKYRRGAVLRWVAKSLFGLWPGKSGVIQLCSQLRFAG